VISTTGISNVENPESHFHFNWNPTSDSASLKALEEENAEYATWNLVDDEQDTPPLADHKRLQNVFCVFAL